jgi:O-antigen ligase
VIAALGLWNYLDPAGWTRWVDGLGLRHYFTDVLHSVTYTPVLETEFGGSTVTRVGSIFLDPIALGYLMLVVVAVAGSRLLRGAGNWIDTVAVLLGVVCTCLTFTRSAIGLLPVLGVALAVLSDRLRRNIGVVVTAAVACGLMAGLFGVGGQIESGLDSNDPRTGAHIDALGTATSRVLRHPLGSGLGTVSGVASRFDVQGRLDTTENFYLQLGVEIGILGTAVFIVLIVVLCRMLALRARRDPQGEGLGAASGLVCVALGGIVLHTFANIPTTWPLFVLIGFALRPVPAYELDPVHPY